MALGWPILLLVAFASPCSAQSLTRQNIATILDFENGTAGAFPSGWTSNNPADAVTDDAVVHSGRFSTRITRGPSSNGTYSDLQFSIPVDFAGRTIELRGFVKTSNINGRVNLVVAERATQGGSNLELGVSQPVNGTSDWKEYSVSLPAVPAAKFLVVQLFMPATGQAWFDDLRLLVDGDPIADAPSGTPNGIPTSTPLTRQNISGVLDFENGTDGAFPARWTSTAGRNAVIDGAVVHGGKYSVRLERGSSSGGTYSDLWVLIPVDFAGQTIELRGYAKTENVNGQINLTVAEQAVEAGPNLEVGISQSVSGTTDWNEYSVSVPAVPAAKILTIRLFFSGTGNAWFDDLQLLVDGKPVSEAPSGTPSGTPTGGFTSPQLTRQNISEILEFENGTPGAFPAGWSFSANRAAVIDDAVVHGGRYSARIERGPSSSGTYSDIQAQIPVDFAGASIELRGFVKTERVTNTVLFGVIERAVANGDPLEREAVLLYGTTDWQEYRVSVPAVPSAKFLTISLYMSGPGKVWIDDLQLLVDGKPIADAQRGVPSGTPSDSPGGVPGTSQQSTRQSIMEILGFENGTPGEFPAGWRSNNPFDATVDKDVVHGGKYSARFERNSSSIGGLTDLFITIPVDFEGQAIELRVFAKTENVAGQVIMSLTESSGGPSLEVNSWKLPDGGTTDWKEYRLSVPAIAAAKLVYLQLYMNGTGKVWFDDLQLFVDGKPIADAPGGMPSGIPSAQPVPRQQSSEILGFENGTPGLFPPRWGTNGTGVVVLDDTVVHGGSYSARIERGVYSAGTSTLISLSIPIDLAGRTIAFRGFAKTENVSDHISLTVFTLAENRVILQAGTIPTTVVKGTTGWMEYRLAIPASPGARFVALSLTLFGTGKVWFDDLELLVDGKPIADTP